MNTTASSSPIRTQILAAISTTAPDVADVIGELGDEVDFFEEFGLDSMDRLNVMTSIAESTGVDIPDDRYPFLTTVRSLIDHLS